MYTCDRISQQSNRLENIDLSSRIGPELRVSRVINCDKL